MDTNNIQKANNESVYERLFKDFKEPSPDDFNCWFYDIDKPCFEDKLPIVPKPLIESIQYPREQGNISKHLLTLYKLATLSKKTLEAGAYMGDSTLALGLGTKENDGHMTSLDIIVRDEAKKRINDNRLDNHVTFVEGSDLKFKGQKESYELIFIDTVHTYRFTIKEIKHFEPMLKVGGIMIFHDLVNTFYTNINDIIEAITAGKHISDCPVAKPRKDYEKSPVYKAILNSFFKKSFLKQGVKEGIGYTFYPNLDGAGLGIVLKEPTE